MTPKPKKCKAKGCGVLFTPHRMGQKACGPACAQEIARAIREQGDRQKMRDERKQDREKREAIKTKPQLTKEAQDEFNRYVRLRDAGKPCICCGSPLEVGEIGGAYDCGHYRSVGSAPHLRFDERNAHGQRKHCNRYGAGRAVDYRLGLIQRVGLGVVEALESDQSPKHYTRDDLRAIKAKYRSLANALQKEAADV